MNVIWLQKPICAETVAVGALDAPWGRMFTVWHGDALSRLRFVDGDARLCREIASVRGAWGCDPSWLEPSDRRLERLGALLDQWPHSDDLRAPTLEMIGSGFQHSVWRILLRLRSGQTMTYGDIAERLGKPGAARAVGRAVGANPVSVLVPCHRVLPATGGTGHYAGGPERKKALLHIEGGVNSVPAKRGAAAGVFPHKAYG
mgnify:CR=1 FL=1